MTIYIEDLKFQTIIGILDFERVQEQELIVNIIIDYDYQDKFINYAEVSEFIKLYIKEQQFLLLEDALSSLSKKLKEKFPLIDKLQLKITKPSIMPDSIVSVSDVYSF
ncbi:MAG: dihydroneopterin aldolase [Campylobacterota bacterium]|nr:dihydroneopterin aldolase [Campylobacterota bacterium]